MLMMLVNIVTNITTIGERDGQRRALRRGDVPVFPIPLLLREGVGGGSASLAVW